MIAAARSYLNLGLIAVDPVPMDLDDHRLSLKRLTAVFHQRFLGGGLGVPRLGIL